MLQIDLRAFQNSDEFRDYIKKHDAIVDKAEALFMGWLFVLLAEISMMLTHLLSYIIGRLKNKKGL